MKANEEPKMQHVIVHKPHKPWYKRWWGFILALCIWPFFLAWFIWKKTKWDTITRSVATVGLVLFVLLFNSWLRSSPTSTSIASTSPSASSTASNTPSSDNTPPSATTAAVKPKTPKIGDPVRDGKFEFVVKSVVCGRTSVGDNQYINKTPQGQYCFVTINVKNIGDSQQYFFEGHQKLLNAGNQQYSPDTVATLYNASNSNVFSSQINPGNSAEGVLIFDIPKDQVPVTAELHDSGLSGGVKVGLQ
jgi:energy-coupling factor transporter transmembrane protein EcfT